MSDDLSMKKQVIAKHIDPILQDLLHAHFKGQYVWYPDELMPAHDGMTADENALMAEIFERGYSEYSGLFRAILARMAQYVADVESVDLAIAKTIQERLFRQYDTTLKGQMVENDVDPHHYSSIVHHVDLSELKPNPVIVDFFKTCSGQRLIFTNGTLFHAERILDALGLTPYIDGIHDIAATNYCPKPDAHAYQSIINEFDVDPHKSVFLEDSWTNLQAARDCGIKTIFVRYGRQMPPAFYQNPPDWVVETIEPALTLMGESLFGVQV